MTPIYALIEAGYTVEKMISHDFEGQIKWMVKALTQLVNFAASNPKLFAQYMWKNISENN